MLQMLCRMLRESNENSDVIKIKDWKFLELHENHEEMFFTASLLFLKINERSLNLILVKCIYKHFLAHIFTTSCKGHSLCKQCLHDLQFMKKGSSSPNLSKLKVAFFSESVIRFSNLQKKYSKKLSWAWNLNFRPITVKCFWREI